MPSYPASVYSRPDPIPALMSDTPTHSTILGQYGDEIEAIEGTLGVNPQGASATVAARLNALSTGAAYTTFTPTSLAQSSALTYTITRARYSQIGKTVLADVELAITNAGVFGAAIVLRCAALPAALADSHVAGIFSYFDLSATPNRGSGIVDLDHTNMSMTFTGGAALGAGMAAGSGDTLSVSLRYEAA